MAEVFLNPAFTAINGRAGNIVFFSYGNRTFFRSYVKPRNPNTAAQTKNRSLFRDAMKAWQELSSFDKDVFTRRARRLGMTGHNLFISRYMRSRSNNTGSEGTEDMASRDIRVLSDTYPSSHIRGHSVCCSMKGFSTYFWGMILVEWPDGSCTKRLAGRPISLMFLNAFKSNEFESVT